MRSGPVALDGRNRGALAGEDARRARSGDTRRRARRSSGSIAVLLTMAPSGARLPRTKRPCSSGRARRPGSGLMITVVGIDAVLARSRSRRRVRRSDASHQSSTSPSALAGDGHARSRSSRPRRRRCSITSGTPPARKTRTVGCGPFGSASTSRGTRRFTASQSSTVGRRGRPRARSPERAAAGSSSRRTRRARPSRSEWRRR